MAVVVGLGNPETRYLDTRHNLGWLVVDRLCDRHGMKQKHGLRHSILARGELRDRSLILAKPTTFMNRSGLAVAELQREYELSVEDDLLIVCDDVTLPLGSLRMRKKGSAGGHNGLKSVEEFLETATYCRLRLGVAQSGMDQMALEDFVLRPFDRDEEDAVLDMIDTAADAVELWLCEGADAAISRFNRRTELENGPEE